MTAEEPKRRYDASTTLTAKMIADAMREALNGDFIVGQAVAHPTTQPTKKPKPRRK